MAILGSIAAGPEIQRMRKAYFNLIVTHQCNRGGPADNRVVGVVLYQSLLVTSRAVAKEHWGPSLPAEPPNF